MKTFPWLIRRELWENRSFYIVPLVLIAVMIFFYAWGLFSAKVSMGYHDGRGLAELLVQEPQHMRLFLSLLAPFLIPTVMLNGVLLLIWFFYLSGTLYGERKDRSVLFWKSLPISDTSTVLSKLGVAMIVLPAITLAAILLSALCITLLNVIAVALTGNNPITNVLADIPLFSAPLLLAYGFVVQSLWYAPLFGWLLLASAWAPRFPALWAILPPAALVILEKLILGTEAFGRFLAVRLHPVVPAAVRDSDIGVDVAGGHLPSLAELIDPVAFLAQPGLWGGLVVAALFVAGAIWSRRYRDTA